MCAISHLIGFLIPVLVEGMLIPTNSTVSPNITEFQKYKQVFGCILKQINELELHLHSEQDYDNNFVAYLLQQQYCTLRLGLIKDASVSPCRHHFWLHANMDQMQQSFSRLNNQGGVYILALQQAPTDSELLQFMTDLWQRYGHNRVFYVLPGFHTLLYNPYLHSFVLAEEPMAYERIHYNMYGHPLRIYIFDSVYSVVFGDPDSKQVTSVTGADAKVAETVAQKLNFSLEYQWPDDEFFGGRTENGSFSGALGRVLRKELDICFTGFFIKDYLTNCVEFSAAVYTDELCLYVQKAKRIPQSILPLFAVRLDVWLCFLCVGFASAFVWLCIRGLNLLLHIDQIAGKEEHYAVGCLGTAMRIFIDTWVMWVRANVCRFPPFHSERIFIISLCLVSVIFGALLESSLATVYIRPLYYKDINTLLELDMSKMPIYIKHPAFQDDLFYGHRSAVYKRLNAKMLLVGEGEERLISMVAQRGSFAGVTRASSLVLNDIRYVMTNRVHQIAECPKSYHIAYVLPSHSPYLKAVNKIVLRLMSGGFIDLWTNEMKERAKWSVHKFPDYLAEQQDMGRWKVLTLTDVQLAFYTLSLGNLLALVMWLIELVCSRWLK